MTGPVIVGLLVAGGLWLVLQPGRVRTVLGFVLLSHAANVTLVLAATGRGTDVPIIGLPGNPADPLPQAFALTAVVIAFGTTAFLLALAAGRADPPGDPTTSRHGAGDEGAVASAPEEPEIGPAAVPDSSPAGGADRAPSRHPDREGHEHDGRGRP